MTPAQLLAQVRAMQAIGLTAPKVVHAAARDTVRKVRAPGVTVRVSPTAQGAVVHYIAVPGPRALPPYRVADAMAPRLEQAVTKALEGL